MENLSVWFGAAQVLHGVSLSLPARAVSVIVGKSGSGKSTLLRAINRLNEVVEGCRTAGAVLIGGADVYAAETDLVELRRRVGMVLQRSSVFDNSIYDNVAYGPRLHGVRDATELDAKVEQSLRRSALWDEAAGRLSDNALSLSGGQQQRLCIARTLAVGPQVLLMDEPTAALDASAEAHIEALIGELSADYTVVLVTHDEQQAARLASFAAVLDAGRLTACGAAADVLGNGAGALSVAE